MYKWKKNCFDKNFVSYLPVCFMDRVCFMYEVIAITEGWLLLRNHDFSRGQTDEIILFMVT